MIAQSSRLKRARRISDYDSPLYVAIGRAGAGLTSLLTAPIIARAVGPQGRGEAAAAIAAVFVVSIVLSFGLPLEVRRRAANEDSEPILRSVRLIGLWMMMPAAVLAAILDFTLFAGLDNPDRVAIAVGVLFAPASLSWLCDQSVLIAHQRFKCVAMLQVAGPATVLMVVVALWLQTGSVPVWCVIGSSVAGTLVTFLLGLRFTAVPLRGRRTRQSELLRGGFRFSGASAADACLNRLDQVLSLPLLGAFQAGLYAVAVTVGSIPIMLGHSLAAAYFNRVARCPHERRMAVVHAGMREAIAMTACLSVILAVLTPVVVPWLFGAEFTGAVVPVLVSLIGSAAFSSSFVAAMMLTALGHGGRLTVAQSLALLVSVILLFALGAPYGALGAATASSIAYCFLLAVMLMMLGARPREVIPRPGSLPDSVRSISRGGT